MKNFLKYTLASIIGVFISIIFLFFIFLGILSFMISLEAKPVETRSNSIIHIQLNWPVSDRTSNNPFDNFDFLNFKFSSRLGLNDILENIKKARDDEKIKGIYLDIGIFFTGSATIEEIRNALIDFKESGKFIISYSDVYTQYTYYLISVADKIYLNPAGLVEFLGFRTEVLFYKGALEKIGIEPQIIRHGKFKSYVEPYMLDKMSDANREQRMKYMGSIWNHILKGISEERNISIDQLNDLADNLTINSSEAALENKLVDGLKYEDEVMAELKELSGISKNRKLRLIYLNKYNKVSKKRKSKGLAKDKVAVIFGSGTIGILEGNDTRIGADRIAGAIRKARLDSTIKAIVFRVSSGGGSALVSEIIWREVDLAKKVKPVIASMGNVAASGGYYIIAPADTIVANPNTLTGSIGVFGIIPNSQKLLNEKLGITVDVAKTNKHSDLGSLYRPLTTAERKFIKAGVEKTYDVFLSHVADGRNMTKEAVDEIAQGRIWSGINAKEIGLIDVLGGLEKAIEIAVEKAKLDHYRIVSLPKQVDPYQMLIKEFTNGFKVSILKKELGGSYRHYKNLNEILKMERIQARLPYMIEIY